MAVAGAVSSGNAGIAGAAVISDYTMVTQAMIAPGSQINKDAAIVGSASQSLTMRADDITTLTSFAGSIGAAFGSAGIGAGLDLGLVDKDTRASIGVGANVAAKGSISVASVNTDSYGSLSTNAGDRWDLSESQAQLRFNLVDTGSRASFESNVATRPDQCDEYRSHFAFCYRQLSIDRHRCIPWFREERPE